MLLITLRKTCLDVLCKPSICNACSQLNIGEHSLAMPAVTELLVSFEIQRQFVALFSTAVTHFLLSEALR